MSSRVLEVIRPLKISALFLSSKGTGDYLASLEDFRNPFKPHTRYDKRIAARYTSHETRLSINYDMPSIEILIVLL